MVRTWVHSTERPCSQAADEEESIRAHAQAAAVAAAAPSVRIQAAWAAASLSAVRDPAGAADILDMAVQLLPMTAPRQLARADKQYALSQASGLASDATALALACRDAPEAGEPAAARALRLLETGRAVMHNQALDTRSDLTALRSRHPALAVRLAELRHLLDPFDAATIIIRLQALPAGTAPSDQETRSQQALGTRPPGVTGTTGPEVV